MRNFVDEKNQDRVILLKNLPFSVEKKDIVQMFLQIQYLEDKDIVIEISQGRKTGFALITLKNSRQVQMARDDLDNQPYFFGRMKKTINVLTQYD